MTQTGTRSNSKVARVIRKYDLDGVGERLEREWTAATDRTSLRDLADEFNREVLAIALREATDLTTEDEISSTYRVLTDDDVSGGDRMRVERKLDRAGVDVEDLRADFVTHQAIHTYLTEYRGAKLPDDSDDLLRRRVEMLGRLRGRTLTVTESTLDELVSTGDIDDHQYEVVVNVRVTCTDCGRDYAVDSLLRDGGCDCRG